MKTRLPILLMLLGVVLVLQAPSSKAAPDVTNCATQTEIPQAECEALVALYHVTNGPDWGDAAWNHWNMTQTPCGWTGVICSAGSPHHVIVLNRHNWNLVGALPDLSALTSLRLLELDNNHLSGPVPSLAALTSLTRLDLTNNELSGSIPDLPASSSLQMILLYGNQLSGSIPDCSQLTGLTYIDLGGNQLSGGVPTTWPDSLEWLILARNPLGGVLPDLSALPHLKWLDLYSAQLSGSIPAALPPALMTLSLHDNQLSGSIPDLSPFTALEFVELQNNQLSGAIPDLSALSDLLWLYLDNNHLSGPLPDLSGLAKMTELSLSNNQLTGSIPNALPPSLHTLNLTNNELTGSIPSTLPANLSGVSLGGNHLGGSIPDLSALKGLAYLDLSRNQLSGRIPNLSALRGLYHLDLSRNALHGSVPADVCRAVWMLDLGYNMLTSEEDPCVTARDPNWARSQTVPPTNVQATYLTASTIQVTWTPILYTEDGGYYEVLCGSQGGGPYGSMGTTATTGGKTASGLAAGVAPYCVVRAFTPAHGDQQNDLTSMESAEAYAPAYYDGGANKLKLDAWRFGASTPGVSGAMAEGAYGIDVAAGPARACWYQEIDGAALRNRTVRFEAEMRKSAVMNQTRPPFTNPYISLQVRKGDGSWIYNYGGILNSRSVAGGPWIGEARDVLLPGDMTTLRATFCVWNANRGTAEARNVLLRSAITPPSPPPGGSLLAPDWTWAPATLGAGGTQNAGVYNIDVGSAGARGCWIQDVPGVPLQGIKVHYEGSLRRSVVMNSAKGFVNPYISLQVRQGNGQWLYNYGGILNATAPPGSFGVVAKDVTLPVDMVTLRAAFCVWDATPGVASGKDFSLVHVAGAQADSLRAETWDEAGLETPSVLAEDGIVQPEDFNRLWLPFVRQE